MESSVGVTSLCLPHSTDSTIMSKSNYNESDGAVTAFGEIVQKDAAKQIVTGPVLVPDKPDREGDIVRKDNVESVAHDYLRSHQQAVDEMHDGRPRPEHSVVESYLAPQDIEMGGETVKEGSWIVSVKLGDEAWEKVEAGEYQGFSIQGPARRIENA